MGLQASAWWSNQWLATTNVTSNVFYPSAYPGQAPLRSVLDTPSQPLGDRDWLDAQVAEVCALAEAA